jgi:hypothetical protein
MRSPLRTLWRQVPLVVVLLGSSVLVGLPAYASWTAPEAAVGTVAAASLGAPEVTMRASGTSVTVLIRSADSGPVPTGYTVSRAGVTVCVLAGPGRCVEDGLTPDNEYTYEVTAHLGTFWVRTSTFTVSTRPSGPVPDPGPGTGNDGGKGSDAPGTDAPATVPAVVALALTGDGDGVAEAGESVTVTFDRPLVPGDLCRGWTGDVRDGPTADGATVALVPGPGEVRLTVRVPEGTCQDEGTAAPAFHFGTIGLAADYVAGDGPVEFTGGIVSLDVDRTTVTITLGVLTTGDPGTVTGTGPATFTPETDSSAGEGDIPLTDAAASATRFVENDAGSF